MTARDLLWVTAFNLACWLGIIMVWRELWTAIGG